MDVLYKSILKRIEAEIPEVVCIAEDCGQLEFPEKEYPVTFPCVLIDIQSIDWTTLGMGTQTGNTLVRLRLAFDIYEDTHKDAPDMDTALTRLKLLNKLHKNIHTFEGMILPVPGHAGQFYDSHFKKLVRTKTVAEKRQDGLRVYAIDYMTNMKDVNAYPDYGSTTVTDVIVQPVP